DKNIELTSVDEVIGFISRLVKSNFNSSPYFLSTTLPNKNIMHFGIGAAPNHIIVLFQPYSISEDCKISCDTSQTYENSPVIKFVYPHSTFIFECNEYNLLSFDFILSRLHSLLVNGDMSCIPCYSH
ncbi:MAG: hypothetical protein RR309_05360, partial [Cellulosilyticaceae bacterium]